MNLTELIAIHKSGRSYEQLAKDCGGVLTSQRLQQIATTPLKSFPAPATVRGLAIGLRISESVVVLAIAESLGLDVGRALPRLVELLPASASLLSDRQAAAIAEVIRAFAEREGGGEHEQRSAPIATETDADFLVSLPDGGVYVIEAKDGTTFAGQTHGDVRKRIQQHLGADAKVHFVDYIPSDIPRTGWDELLAMWAGEEGGSVHALSAQTPTVPLKRVARRTTKPDDTTR